MSLAELASFLEKNFPPYFVMAVILLIALAPIIQIVISVIVKLPEMFGRYGRQRRELELRKLWYEVEKARVAANTELLGNPVPPILIDSIKDDVPHQNRDSETLGVERFIWASAGFHVPSAILLIIFTISALSANGFSAGIIMGFIGWLVISILYGLLGAALIAILEIHKIISAVLGFVLLLFLFSFLYSLGRLVDSL